MVMGNSKYYNVYGDGYHIYFSNINASNEQKKAIRNHVIYNSMNDGYLDDPIVGFLYQI